MNSIQEGSKVLYLWQGEIGASIERNVTALKNINNVTVNVENVERISLGECKFKKFLCTLYPSRIYLIN